MQPVMRERFSSGSSWEPRIGCSRAVRVGNALFISGTAPLAPDGVTTASSDPLQQARRCFEIIEQVIRDAGFNLSDVVRTRVYFRDEAHWPALADAHGERFSTIRPACTFLRVAGFASPEWHVEVEAECLRAENS